MAKCTARWHLLGRFVAFVVGEGSLPRAEEYVLGEELLNNYKCVAYAPFVPIRGDATASLESTAAVMAHNPIGRNFILVLVRVGDFQ